MAERQITPFWILGFTFLVFLMLAFASPLGEIVQAAPVIGPTLAIPQQIPANANTVVSVPIQFTSNGNSISSMVFSVDFDETKLIFNPSTPMSITLNLPAGFTGDCAYNGIDTSGEIDCFVMDPVVPLTGLPDGTVATIKLTTANIPYTVEAMVGFSVNSPPTSFGNSQGQSVPGTTVNGSILINPGQTTPPPPATRWLYLPLMFRQNTILFTISGRVLLNSSSPLSGVFVSDGAGHSSTTDSNGDYLLSPLAPGSYTVTATKSGYSCTANFSNPVSVPPSGTDKNFNCIPTACSDIVLNGGFEADSTWIFPTVEIPASYSTIRSRSGVRSARTGILSLFDNRTGHSSVQQTVTIPADATAAWLRFYLFMQSGNFITNQLNFTHPKSLISKLLDTSSGGDYQYVLILDSGGNILRTLVWVLSNDQAWVFQQFSIMLNAGQTVKLHFGTYNDGGGYVTAMFVDDVSLEICR